MSVTTSKVILVCKGTNGKVVQISFLKKIGSTNLGPTHQSWNCLLRLCDCLFASNFVLHASTKSKDHCEHQACVNELDFQGTQGVEGM